MYNERLLKIIKEEIEQMYQDTGILGTFPELKEAVLKFNRLVDEGFDKVEKLNDKPLKYNISNIESIQKDKDIVDEIIVEISELEKRFSRYANESPQISDEEAVEVKDMLEHVSKYLYSISNLSKALGFMASEYEKVKEGLSEIRSGSAPLNDINNFKIFIN